MFHGVIDDGLDVFGARDICLLERDRCPQFVSDLLASLGVNVGDDHLGPFFDEAVDRAPSDAGNAPGDDRDLSCQQ